MQALLQERNNHMPNSVTFDDGLNYIAISEIESFGYDNDKENDGGTVIKVEKNGHAWRSQWSVEEIAKRLGPTTNLHY
jgi:hypothetical protein